MILSDTGIKEALSTGQIVIDPLPEEDQYDASSVDLRLGNEFKKYKRELVGQEGIDTTIDPERVDYAFTSSTYMEVVKLSQGESIVIEPEGFLLAITLERVHFPEESQIAARIEGRSTLARTGLSIHLTAPTVHLGFEGHLALELKNHGKLGIRLTPGMQICQLIFERVVGEASPGSRTSFQGQTEP